MKERPIIMNTEMVRAILAGRKTQTRRVMKPQPELDDGVLYWENSFFNPMCFTGLCPLGKIGDKLWVKEAWTRDGCGNSRYKTDHEAGFIWKPPSRMPRWASRITLEMTDIRVEGVQDISEEDAKAEGCEGIICNHEAIDDCGGVMACTDCMNTGWLESPKYQFMKLWNSIYGKDAWKRNDWVWCLTFKKV